jgi:hypothetical protein
MRHPGHPAPAQREGCSWDNTQAAELLYLRTAQHSLDMLLETYWTTGGGVEAADCSYALMRLTTRGTPGAAGLNPGWPQERTCRRTGVGAASSRMAGRTPHSTAARMGAGREPDEAAAPTQSRVSRVL